MLRLVNFNDDGHSLETTKYCRSDLHLGYSIKGGFPLAASKEKFQNGKGGGYIKGSGATWMLHSDISKLTHRFVLM
jgi:hypothetical protein